MRTEIPGGGPRTEAYSIHPFRTASCQMKEVPIPILQPTVLYWYGRAFAGANDPGDCAPGRAMVEAALANFHALEMVLHAKLAERFLRGQ